MASKGTNSEKLKPFGSAYKDRTGGVIIGYEDWKKKFIPEILAKIDRKVQELKLQLKFDKAEPPKQGMFNRLSNWWSNIFWGKHNKYHNPHYHRNIMGALGAPSRKNEMTLGIYKILKEASEKYELLIEKRLVVDDIVDDWAKGLNDELRSYLMYVADDNYYKNDIIQGAFRSNSGAGSEKESGSTTATTSTDDKEKKGAKPPGGETASATSTAEKSGGETDAETSTAAKSGGENVSDANPATKPPVTPDTAETEPDSSVNPPINKEEPKATAETKPRGRRKKGASTGSGDTPSGVAEPVTKQPELFPPNPIPPDVPPPAGATSGDVEPPALSPVPQPDTSADWARNAGRIVTPEDDNQDMFYNWREKQVTTVNPLTGGVDTTLPTPETFGTDYANFQQNVLSSATEREKNKLRSKDNPFRGRRKKKTNEQYEFEQEIDILEEIEGEEEFDDNPAVIYPVNFEGLTLYERTLVCLENLRRR